MMTTNGKILFLLQLFAFPCIAFVISMLLTRYSIKLLCRLGFAAEMGNRHIHKKVIPTTGGIGMIASFALICIIYNLWVMFLNKSPEVKSIDPVFFLPVLMLFFVGLYDDRIGMRAVTKLIGQVAAAVLAWYCNIRLKSIFGIQLPEAVSCTATIIWFLMFINAFNLIDGLDGLASGLAVQAGITIAVVLMIGHHWTAAVTAMCIAAVSLGFLRYNFHPARIFMGDTGSMFLGYTLAAIGLISSNLNTSFFAVLIPVMACGVPLIDTTLAVWRRSTFKILKKQSWREIFSADRSHLHHRILDAYCGNQSRAAVVIYILAMIISIVGVVSSIIADTLPMLAVLMVVITMIEVLRKFAVVEISNSTKIVFKGLAMPRRGIFINILHPVYDMAIFGGSFFLSIIFFENVGNERDFIYRTVISVLVLTMVLIMSRNYRIYWLRAGTPDYLRLSYSITLGFLLVLIVNTAFNYFCKMQWSLIVLLPAYLMSLVLILGERLHLRALQLVMPYYYRASKFSNSNSVPVLLYGAGAQLSAYHSCINFYWHKHNEKIIGIVDDDTALHGLSVYGHRILGDLSLLENIYEREKFCRIVVITPNPIRKNYEFIKNFCNKNSVELTFFTISETGEPETLRENPQEVEE